MKQYQNNLFVRIFRRYFILHIFVFSPLLFSGCISVVQRPNPDSSTWYVLVGGDITLPVWTITQQNTTEDNDVVVSGNVWSQTLGAFKNALGVASVNISTEYANRLKQSKDNMTAVCRRRDAFCIATALLDILSPKDGLQRYCFELQAPIGLYLNESSYPAYVNEPAVVVLDGKQYDRKSTLISLSRSLALIWDDIFEDVDLHISSLEEDATASDIESFWRTLIQNIYADNQCVVTIHPEMWWVEVQFPEGGSLQQFGLLYEDLTRVLNDDDANHGLESTGAPPTAGTPETHP